MLTVKTILGAALVAAALAAPASAAAATGPSVTIGGGMTPAEGKRINSWEEYRFSVRSGAVALHCGVDVAADALPECPQSYLTVTGAGLSQGRHVVRARARDAAGNWGGVAERSFIWDTIGPVTTLTAPAATNALRPTVGIAMVEEDPVRIVTCVLERGGEQLEYRPGCGTSWTAAEDLPEGEYDLTVHTYDSAGNGGAKVARIVVDRTTPAAPELSASGAVLRMAAEPGATFECRTIASAWSACASPFDGSKLGAGTHTVTVRAVDAAGNRSAERYLTVTVPAPPQAAPAPPQAAPAAPVTAAPSVVTPPAPRATVTAPKAKPAARRMTCAKARRIKSRKARAKAVKRYCAKRKRAARR